LLFEVDPEPLPEMLTAWGGVPLVVQAFRSLGLPASVRQHVRVKERERGYDEASMSVRDLTYLPQENAYVGPEGKTVKDVGNDKPNRTHL
jgi:hypothetical protein